MSKFVANLTPSEDVPKTRPVTVLDVSPFHIQRSVAASATARDRSSASASASPQKNGVKTMSAQQIAQYLSRVQQAPITLRLLLTQDEAFSQNDVFSDLYSVQIIIASHPNFSTFETIVLPRWSRSQPQTHEFSIRVLPVASIPTTLNLKMEFHGHDGSAYSCQLPSLHLTLTDYFVPLSSGELNQAESALFRGLWAHLSRQLASSDGGDAGFASWSLSNADVAMFDEHIVHGEFAEEYVVFPMAEPNGLRFVSSDTFSILFR